MSMLRGIMIAALLAGAAGCGGGGDPEQAAAFRGAERTLQAYMKALQEGDVKTAYGCLSWQRRREIPLADIEADYASHRDRFHYRAGGKIERSHYDGFRVFAKLVNGDGRLEFVSLVPEDGAWKIEETGGSIVEVIEKNQRAGARSHPEEPGGKGS